MLGDKDRPCPEATRKAVRRANLTGSVFSGLRVITNLYTTKAELDRFCDVLESVAKKGLPAN